MEEQAVQAVEMLDSDQAQALETQIEDQTLTVKESLDYFGTGVYGVRGERATPYATPDQLRQLSHKSRTAVKGLDPWESCGPFGDLFRTHSAKPLTIPEPATCEFCGKPLNYIAILRRTVRGLYDWEVRKWSTVPQRCDCQQAREKWAAQEAAEQRQREAALRLEQQAQVEMALAQSGMKKRFLARTFDNFQTDTTGREKAYRSAKKYADNFQANQANGEGLYIEGTFGTGKTHLAAAIAIQLMTQRINVVFGTADDLLQGIKAAFSKDGKDEQRAVDRLKNCDLLVIDDIGKEQATDWTTAQLYAIINDRYESQRPVIITTNFNETDLIAVESPKGVGEHRIRAILSRLHETCRKITMSWQDWRGGT